VFPQELETLPVVAEQAGFRVVGLLATHADWDHVLGRMAFPEAPLGCAPSTAERLRAEPGEPQRRLREFDEEHYLERAPLAMPAPETLPVPGHCGVGDAELELHRAEGHTGDGMAVLIPWAHVLCPGDYLSPVEIPMLSPGGSRDLYLETLDRLEQLVERADHVVPGHGDVIDAERALAILREDRAYLEALPKAKLPLARRTAAQKKIHAANVERLST
jgi:glyoxylase-like metal-dependent hydrolase (beta-lactamase superfamily II)